MNVCETCLNNIFNDILRFGSPQMDSMRLCDYCVGKVKSLQEFALRCSNANGSLDLNQSLNTFDVQKLIDFCRQQFQMSECCARRKPKCRNWRRVNTNRDFCRWKKLFDSTNKTTKVIGRKGIGRKKTRSPQRRIPQNRLVSECRKPKRRKFKQHFKSANAQDSLNDNPNVKGMTEVNGTKDLCSKLSSKFKQKESKENLEGKQSATVRQEIHKNTNSNINENSSKPMDDDNIKNKETACKVLSRCCLGSKGRKAMKEFECKSKGFARKIAKLEKLMAVIKNKKNTNIGKVIKNLDSQLQSLVDQRKSRITK